ncbi:hypothetical protein Chor_008320 [Crotalus horridus]
MGFSTIVHTYEYGIFSRLLSGVCSGIFSCAVPLYLAEIAPRNLRGGIMTMGMVAVAVGVLISQILGLREFLGSERKWAILLSLTGVLAVFQLFLLPKFPEILKVLRAKEDVEEDIEELHQEDIAELEEKEMSVLNRLTCKGLRRQIICVVLLMAGQQFTGINAVYYYAETIYRTVWLNRRKPRYISIMSSIFVLLTLLFVTYSIDSLGRRLLILVGLGICSTFCVLLTISQELQRKIGSYSFLMFWPLCIASFVFIFRNIPETKQKNFLQIRNLLALQALKRINVQESQGKSDQIRQLDGGRRKKPRAMTSTVPSVPSI